MELGRTEVVLWFPPHDSHAAGTALAKQGFLPDGDAC